MSTREDLQGKQMHELRTLAGAKGIKYETTVKKDELIDMLLGQETPTTKVEEAPPAPATVTLTADQFAAMMARIAALESRPAETKPEIKDDDAMSVKQVLKLFADRLDKRGESTPEGFAESGSVGPEDLLPEPVRFWTRSPQYHIRSLRVGPVPEKLPRGHKVINFTRVFGPVKLVDPNFPIPRTICMCQFVTSDKVLVEKMRADVRYRMEFFDDISEAASLDNHGEEYRRAYEGWKQTIRANADPNYVLQVARQHNVPFTAETSPEKTLHQVASILAQKDAERALDGHKKMIAETQRQMSLAQKDGVAIPV